jgi:predicted NUDIX family phosphoesterase
VPRKLAERDANVRHIIPYVVIRNNRGEILAYPRKGKEDRIHRQWSVGFGGHMSPGDLQFNPNSVEPNLNKSIEHCAIRELQEELPEHSAEWHSDNLKFLGIVVHDDSKTDVPISYVHLGAIYSITVDEDFKPSSMEEGEDKSPLTWITPASRNAFRFEHWARALLDYFGSPVIF